MKILVIRYRFIGDTILTVPFLRNLRRAYPDAQIDMLVGPMSGELLENCPYIDNLIYFDTTRKHKYENKNKKRRFFLSYVFELRKQQYDKAYILKRSWSSALLAFLAKIPERIGFDTEKRGFLLTHKVPYLEGKHEIECFLDVLRADNIEVKDNYLENWISPQDSAKINNIFKKNNIKNGRARILVHATAGNERKQWPEDYFAKVMEYLVNKKNAQLFFVGTESDQEIYEQIFYWIKKPLKPQPINLCGALSITESCALIKRMDLVIGVDSGNLHLAASLNIPTIGIYGPMDPVRWKAFGDIHIPLWAEDYPCMPCNLRTECEESITCLEAVKVETVLEAIEEMFKRINICNSIILEKK